MVQQADNVDGSEHREDRDEIDQERVPSDQTQGELGETRRDEEQAEGSDGR